MNDKTKYLHILSICVTCRTLSSQLPLSLWYCQTVPHNYTVGTTVLLKLGSGHNSVFERDFKMYGTHRRGHSEHLY